MFTVGDCCLSLYFYNELWHFLALLSPQWMRYEFYHLVKLVVYSRVEFTVSIDVLQSYRSVVTFAEQDRIERVTVKPLQVTAKFSFVQKVQGFTAFTKPALIFFTTSHCTPEPCQYRPLVNTVVTSQCTGQGNKDSVARRSNVSPQRSVWLWNPPPSIQRDTVPRYFYRWWNHCHVTSNSILHLEQRLRMLGLLFPIPHHEAVVLNYLSQVEIFPLYTYWHLIKFWMQFSTHVQPNSSSFTWSPQEISY
jgi:hypothetical protein